MSVRPQAPSRYQDHGRSGEGGMAGPKAVNLARHPAEASSKLFEEIYGSDPWCVRTPEQPASAAGQTHFLTFWSSLTMVQNVQLRSITCSP